MTQMKTHFVLTLFTNDLELARRADAAGIDRIGLDLESIGKAQRQGHLKTWISDHQEAELPALAATLTRAKLFARTNPIHPGSPAEIDRLIEAGVDVLMLPMFHTAEEAACFADFIGGRAEVSLLVETAAAAARIHEVVKIPGIDEIHIGLNDLHLDLGLSNHFELLCSPLLAMLAAAVHGAGIPFGFGGIGRLDDARLPVSSDLIYAQYARHQADRALVSRVFVTPDYRDLDLPEEVCRFRRRMDYWHQACPATIDDATSHLYESAKRFHK